MLFFFYFLVFLLPTCTTAVSALRGRRNNWIWGKHAESCCSSCLVFIGHWKYFWWLCTIFCYVCSWIEWRLPSINPMWSTFDIYYDDVFSSPRKCSSPNSLKSTFKFKAITESCLRLFCHNIFFILFFSSDSYTMIIVYIKKVVTEQGAWKIKTNRITVFFL